MNKAPIRYVISFCFICLFSAGVLTIYAQSEEIEQTTQSSPTPIPTATDYNLLPIVEGLLLDNGGCDLPCWWGFNVGESAGSDWVDFMEEHGLTEDKEDQLYFNDELEVQGGNILYDLGSWYADFNIIFNLASKKLTNLEVYFLNPNEWLTPEIATITLPGLLAQIETPEIYVYTDSLGQWSFADIKLRVINEEEGIMAYYTFDIRDHQAADTELYTFGNKLNLCLGLKETKGLTITIQDPDIQGPVNDTLERSRSSSRAHTIDETLGVDAETFTEFFIDNPDGCLEVSYLKPE